MILLQLVNKLEGYIQNNIHANAQLLPRLCCDGRHFDMHAHVACLCCRYEVSKRILTSNSSQLFDVLLHFTVNRFMEVANWQCVCWRSEEMPRQQTNLCDMSEKSQASVSWRSEKMPRQQTNLWHVREKPKLCVCWRSEEMPRQQTNLWHVREKPSLHLLAFRGNATATNWSVTCQRKYGTATNFDKQLCKLYTSRGHKTCTNRFCTHSASNIILILYQTGNILYGKLRFKNLFYMTFFQIEIHLWFIILEWSTTRRILHDSPADYANVTSRWYILVPELWS
jgi:hypothetical protein